MKKFDKVIIIFFIAVALFGGIFIKINQKKNYSEKYAEIYVEGALYKKVILDNSNQKEIINIETNLGKNVVEINNGGVRITDSDCPDKICVKDGFKSNPGEVLVCLPHKVVIEIKGKNNKSEVDSVSH